MASSKVMASTSPPNPDLPRQSATPSSVRSSSSSGLAQTTPLSSVSNLLQQPNPLPNPNLNSTTTNNHHLQYSDRSSNSPFGSMNMEEILKNIYSEPDSLVDDAGMSGMAGIDGGAGGGVVKNVANKTVDEVWKEIVSGGGESREPRMTLEDFLTKAGAVSEEDVRVHNSAPTPLPLPVQAPAAGGPGGYGVEAVMNVQFPVAPGPVVHMQNGPGGFGLESQLGFGNGMVAAASSALGGNGGNGSATGRGKRRAAPVEELAIDKATQQKQRRMIKNRESAARSRERKQAYTVELESLVTQLEEENARLLREEAEQNKERYKQLMENLIPVVEKQRPPRVLRRVKSSIW